VGVVLRQDVGLKRGMREIGEPHFSQISIRPNTLGAKITMYNRLLMYLSESIGDMNQKF
jgi:hypothetical protein